MRSGANEWDQILIVEDDSVLRGIFRQYLEHSGYRVTAVGSGQEALRQIQKRNFRVATLDVQLPDIDGLELARRLRGYQPGLSVLFVTAFGSIEVAVEAMRQGALYYIEKPVDLEKLLEIIEEALREKQRAAHLHRWVEILTPREQNILAQLAHGKTNEEVADDLSLSIHTINTHVRNVLAKLCVKNRVQAALVWVHVTGAVDVTEFSRNT